MKIIVLLFKSHKGLLSMIQLILKEVLIQVVAWCRTGEKPLQEIYYGPDHQSMQASVG